MKPFTTSAMLRAFGLAGLLGAGEAYAAGFQITEHSTTGLGRGFAGAGMVGDDASAVFFNPAGMTLANKNEFQAGLSFISPTGEFQGDSTVTVASVLTDPPTPVGPSITETGTGDADTGVFVPHTYFIASVNDRLKLGLGITSPFGLRTTYSKSWPGRYQGIDSDLLTVDINPSVAYRFNEYVSIGAGFSAQYVKATLTRAIFTGFGMPDGFAKVKADDWSFGFDVGVMVEIDPDTRFGVSYRSRIEHDVDGEGQLRNVGERSGDVDAEATAELPETVHIGVYKEFHDRWGLSFTARWTRWEVLDELVIEFADGTESVEEFQWENSWTLAFGVDYRHDDDWTVRAGYVYDQSPTPNAEFRSVRVADSDRHWATIGAAYRPRPDLTLDFGYAHLFFEDARIDRTETLMELGGGVALLNTLEGEYESNAHIFSASVNWSF